MECLGRRAPADMVDAATAPPIESSHSRAWRRHQFNPPPPLPTKTVGRRKGERPLGDARRMSRGGRHRCPRCRTQWTPQSGATHFVAIAPAARCRGSSPGTTLPGAGRDCAACRRQIIKSSLTVAKTPQPRHARGRSLRDVCDGA